MLIQVAVFMCAIQVLTKKAECRYIDLSSDSDNPETSNNNNEPVEKTISYQPAVKSENSYIPDQTSKVPGYASDNSLPKETPKDIPNENYLSVQPSTVTSYPPIRSTEGNYPPIKSSVQDTYPPVKLPPGAANEARRFLSSDFKPVLRQDRQNFRQLEEEIDLKNKIKFLIAQTMHDTEKKIKSVQKYKEQYRETGPYRAGFLLSLVKKNKIILNDLFNMAIKNRDSWKALEHLKIFEFITHVNVDTTHFIRRLVEIHIDNLDTTPKPELT